MRSLLLTLLFCLFFVSLPAKECARCRLVKGWGLAATPKDAFDPQKIRTFKGEITSTQTVEPETSLVPGVYLLLAVGEDQIPVRLGPDSFLKKSALCLEPDQPLEVTGSVIEIKGREAVIATELKQNGIEFQLRSPSGLAAWNGQLE